MNKTLESVKQTEKLLIYKINDVSGIDKEFMDKLPWPLGITTQIFLLANSFENDFEAIYKNLDGKYYCRFLYDGRATDLVIPSSPNEVTEIKEYVFKDIDELRKMYIATTNKYFRDPWSQFLGKRYDDEISAQAKKNLSLERTLCLAKNNIPVALLNLTDTKHFLTGEAVDWVLWIWIDAALQEKEKKDVRYQFVKWLQSQTKTRLRVGVNAFNARSHRFFRKIGLKAECIGITKEK